MGPSAEAQQAATEMVIAFLEQDEDAIAAIAENYDGHELAAALLMYAGSTIRVMAQMQGRDPVDYAREFARRSDEGFRERGEY